EIPQIYVGLANECMSANASERPSASELQEYLDSWTKKSCYIKTFKEADTIKHESGPLNNCMISYQLVKRLIDLKPTNLKKNTSDSDFNEKTTM
ncbi:36417_t:CDS:1, partial [Racocetra persica]